ncbi:Phosphoenolpyruvate synthase/pyruvate phosphate dikinase [Desulfatibacillum aliphaticivorans]|uniref:Pyruvate, phosphate dikinase n=1 Tax=Desulfatibacillum aliphaticivorans TaxID=218208 RepID=B8FEA8_DESAL|nr:pyruvate, phosphate dikinase [Desulfatibacillum aliphaticivorans]ACL06889.1 Phosphoenolpyruvate synthase/pyruvate phosphate dikinase [Desulfatibacillum aliphaticivorans]
MKQQYVYFFGGGMAQGRADMNNLLGGKGANIAEMVNLGLPVPPGFTLTTELCNEFNKRNREYPKSLEKEVEVNLRRLEELAKKKFGDPVDPLLVSVRSGARASMPGMMETVLNVGLTEETIPGMIAKTQNPRFVYDAYRRLIAMYSDVVMEKAEGIEPEDGDSIRNQLEHMLEAVKKKNGYVNDTELSEDDLKELCAAYKVKVKEVLGAEFPDDPMKQLWGAIGAVFLSWNGKRALAYRRIENLPDDWGTAVNVQAMVFGNTGDKSATGVAFTRNPATGDNNLYGEWLINAQGEDVVAGIRTPYAINKLAKTDANKDLPTLEEAMPKLYQDLMDIREKLETHYRDMQDLEFTIEDNVLYMLQTRVGKRNGPAAIKMAVDMAKSGLIDKDTALKRVKPEQVEELLHPMVDPEAEKLAEKLGKGLPAGPGGAIGKIVLTADKAMELGEQGRRVILVREETSPEDVHGMKPAQAILTSKGGMTSHAALVARGWGKCCIVGCSAMEIDMKAKTVTFGDKVLKEGDWITMNGTKGVIYEGQLDLVEVDPLSHKEYRTLMTWADKVRTLKIRTNADTPEDAAAAVAFGAQGIGLTRTEHMFFGDRIWAMREMIMAEDIEGRKAALRKLLPMQRQDFTGIFKAMGSRPVTIRLLDPPLHEFLPHDDEAQKEMASLLNTTEKRIAAKAESLTEFNPMLGHRGCRLGTIFPEITAMQARAIFEAAADCWAEDIKVKPEVMVPLVGTVGEFENQKAIIDQQAAKVMDEKGITFKYMVGTMIEIPRACLIADQIAQQAEFFSFGTNDLTQMTFGYSRDDAGTFLPHYLERKILAHDPFQSVDQTGVGELMKIGTERGRTTRPKLKIGICGEHGGDPKSVWFCDSIGLDYVSCSPYRVPIARLAAAHAALANGHSVE